MKRLVWTAALLAALTLSGCGAQPAGDSPAPDRTDPPKQAELAEVPAQGGETPAEAPAPEGKTPDAAPAQDGVSAQAPAEISAEEARPLTADLEFLVEGRTETAAATLYVGQGYSVYIPNEGWLLEQDVDDGVLEESWESTLNDDVKLEVLHLGQRTLAECQAFLRREEDDYQWTEDKQGGLLGVDQEDREQMEVRFIQGAGETFAVLCAYPETAAEGFGVRLRVMADTFALTS